jgi:uncharacterized protein (DUF362 family)
MPSVDVYRGIDHVAPDKPGEGAAMTRKPTELSDEPRVAVARVPEPAAGNRYETGIAGALTHVGRALGWADGERGPLARVVPRGAKVLIKPNFVMHRNEGAGGLEPLITHPAVVRAVVDAALQAEASQVIVGDAPLQSCDFGALLDATGLARWARERARAAPAFKGIRDFRRTTCVVRHGVRIAAEDQQPQEDFILFDLRTDSLLEAVTDPSRTAYGAFRVTWYDPRLTARTHQRGRHQYLVARDIIDADIVINLPKLKTHKKAGVTCALKNLIGINGNKEFLPHHRIGGSADGGDCYPGRSAVKRALEHVADRQNLTASYAAALVWRAATFLLHRLARANSDRIGYDGSWSGNDTIWRTCLDLNRILVYGCADAAMAEAPQRRIIHVVDAVTAGQGDGPLAPDPLALGLLLAGESAPAVDWVGAQLLGYDPMKIHVVREAFSPFRWPLTSFPREAVTVVMAGDHEASGLPAPRVVHPIGWRAATVFSDRRGDSPFPSVSRAVTR